LVQQELARAVVGIVVVDKKEADPERPVVGEEVGQEVAFVANDREHRRARARRRERALGC
jgi:hypothetical protein